jgi:hypothetical protein
VQLPIPPSSPKRTTLFNRPPNEQPPQTNNHSHHDPPSNKRHPLLRRTPQQNLHHRQGTSPTYIKAFPTTQATPNEQPSSIDLQTNNHYHHHPSSNSPGSAEHPNKIFTTGKELHQLTSKPSQQHKQPQMNNLLQ